MSPVLILDGGLGTTLEQNHGVRFGSSTTPLWSSSVLVSDPSTLHACQKSFGDVPVDVILTATYQVSLKGFQDTKTSEYPNGVSPSEIPHFLDRAITIAEHSKQPNAKIAVSLGPYGACMIPSQEYTGTYDTQHNTESSLQAWHLSRLTLLQSVKDISSRVGFIALETIPRIDEISAIRRAISALPEPLAGIPFWTSCLFPGELGTLPDGSDVGTAVRAMLDPGLAKAVPWGIGINCTKVGKLDGLLRWHEAAVEDLLAKGVIQAWPSLILYPDGTNGEVYDTKTQTWVIPDGFDTKEHVPWETQLTTIVNDTQARGQWPTIVVGGCCMSSPTDIAKLRASLLGSNKPPIDDTLAHSLPNLPVKDLTTPTR